MDARRFFAAGIDIRGNLPQSLLRTTYNEVATGIIPTHLNVPYALLLGQESGEASYSADTSVEQGLRSRRTEDKTFRHVPAALKTALQRARSKHFTSLGVFAGEIGPKRSMLGLYLLRLL